MPTSGTYSWTLAGDDMLAEAWERCGRAPETLTGAVLRSALRSVQLMLIDWTNAGLNLWQVDQQTTTIGAGVSAVSTSPATTDLLEAYVTVGGANRQLAQISRDEYAAIPQPTATSSGGPTQVWVERVNPQPIMHLWPVPTVATALTYNRIRLPQDFSALGQTLDAPLLWMEASCAGLAARLAEKYAPERQDKLEAKAMAAFARAAGENRERVPLTILPDFSR